MDCPACKDVTLVMADRQGVEIDYCPRCRGVWLDRGELDKIIERSASFGSGSAPGKPRDADVQPRREHDEYRHGDPKRHRKKGFLGDLFDFD